MIRSASTLESLSKQRSRDPVHFRFTLARLDELVCQQAKSVRIRYRLQAFGRDVESQPEFVPALFNPRTLTLTVVTGTGKVSWAAVARELAVAVLPDEDPGRFAAGLKEVLAAEDEEDARVALDELGFARLQMESAAPEQPVEATGELGEDIPPPEDFTDDPSDEPPDEVPPPMETEANSGDADENTPATQPPLEGSTGGGGSGQRHQGRRKRRQSAWLRPRKAGPAAT